MRFLFLFFTALFILLPLSPHAYSVETPQEMLSDPQDEERAEELGNRLRCLVCQNESIEDSTAPLARDIRHLVRIQIKHGKTNQEILDWMTQRYGDFIRLKPRFTTETSLLWIIPLLTLIIGFYYAYTICRHTPLPPAPLTEEEKKLLQKRTSLEDHKS